MALFSAETAYSLSFEERTRKKETFFERFDIIFNKKVYDNASKGKCCCIFSWEELELDSILIIEETVNQILNFVLDAGYHVEFLYESISSNLPNGILIFWGKKNNQENELQSFIEEERERGHEFYRSEE